MHTSCRLIPLLLAFVAPSALAADPPVLDAAIRLPNAPFLGTDLQNATAKGQTVEATVNPGAPVDFVIQVRNLSDTARAFFVEAPELPEGWKARYSVKGIDLTNKFAEGWESPELAPHEEFLLQITLESSPTAATDIELPIQIQEENGAGADTVGIHASFKRPSLPDALIKVDGEDWKGEGHFDSQEDLETGGDQMAAQFCQGGTPAIYHLKLLNAGAAEDSLSLQAPAPPYGWKVRYLEADGRQDVTAEVNGAGYRTPPLPPGEAHELRIEVAPNAAAKTDPSFDTLLTIASVKVPQLTDHVLLRDTWLPGASFELRLGPVKSELNLAGGETVNTDDLGQMRKAVLGFGKTAVFTAYLNTEEPNTSVRVHGPLGDAGWRVRYFAGAEDVTAAVTGDGWEFKSAKNLSRLLAVQITPIAAVGPASRTVALRADGLHDAAVSDVVLAQVTRAATVDVSLRPELTGPFIGEDVTSLDGAGQSYSCAEAVGSNARGKFVARVTNRGLSATTFTLHAETTAPNWTPSFHVDEPVHEDITAKIKRGKGWVTPVLKPGESQDVFIVIEPESAGVEDPTAHGTVLLTASTPDQSYTDAVKVELGSQRIAKLQYSVDQGQHWADAPTFESGQAIYGLTKTTVGIRAVPMWPGLDWPIVNGELMPKWDDAGYWLVGEKIWVVAGKPDEKGREISATCGETVRLRLCALETYDLIIDVAQVYVPPGGGEAGQTKLSLTVTDSAQKPLAGVKVRFTTTFEDGKPAGEINDPGPADDFGLTNANGVATVTLHTGSREGNVTARGYVQFEGKPEVPSDALPLVFGVLKTEQAQPNDW